MSHDSFPICSLFWYFLRFPCALPLVNALLCALILLAYIAKGAKSSGLDQQYKFLRLKDGGKHSNVYLLIYFLK